MGLDTFGKFPETGCIYGTQVKNGKFVVVNKGKPVIGKLVGSKDALEANAHREPVLVTTTTAGRLTTGLTAHIAACRGPGAIRGPVALRTS